MIYVDECFNTDCAVSALYINYADEFCTVNNASFVKGENLNTFKTSDILGGNCFVGDRTVRGGVPNSREANVTHKRKQ